MRRLEESRKIYESIEIPEELDSRIRLTVQGAERKRRMNIRKEKRRKVYKWAMGIAAALAAATTVGLNTSEVFAMEMQEIPIIGEIAKVLTIRSYEKTEGDTDIKAEVPAVDLGENEELALTEEEINAQIEKMVSEYEAEAVQRAEEYKEAFLETGGTEEEWAAHDIQIDVWYEVKNETEDVLSFVVKGTESWTSAYSETRYYNLDLKTGEFLTLADLLGEDYIAKANESILTQMKEQMAADENVVYWIDNEVEEWNFKTITDETAFYVNEKGNPVVVFEKYEGAPGSMGEVEFEIAK